MSFDLLSLQTVIVSFGLNLFWAVVTLAVGWWAAKLLARWLRRGLAKAKVEPSLIGFLGNLTYWGIFIFAIIAALARLGVQTASIIAVLGAAGLAVGLALQGSLANFAAGVLILLFKPYRVGDVIEISGDLGKVKEIQIFNTVLESPDWKTIIVPNAQVTGGSIINYTTKGMRRVDLVFGIGYGDDLLKAKQLLEQILAEDARVLAEPPPTVAVLELADHSVNLAVQPYVKVDDYLPVLFDTTEKVKLIFDREGISFPFPQREVHIYQAN
jgi:small conductance mechanosensitive channel